MSKKSTETEKEESEINPQNEDNTTEKKELTCGIVMPISTIDGCSADHWADVRNIIEDSICDAGFTPNLVSDADDSGIIQHRIVQNIYKNDIVVCDVSAKNPNVMFELGLRLAFDKPTIIVKDDKTDYSFDTSIIEHIPYPRDLRFNKINKFKQALTDKIQATHKAAQIEGYTTFLKHFGEFKVAKLEQKEVSSDRYIIESLSQIRSDIFSLSKQVNNEFQNRIEISNQKHDNKTDKANMIFCKELLNEFSEKYDYTLKDIVSDPNKTDFFIDSYISKYISPKTLDLREFKIIRNNLKLLLNTLIPAE